MSVRFTSWLLALAVSLFCGFQAKAGELHSFLLDDCRTEAGLVVNVDEDRVTLIDLQGYSRELKTNEIKSIYIYTYLNNPLPAVRADETLRKNLKKVVVEDGSADEDDRTEQFYGWPVRFVESLFMFYDTQGNVRVYERDRLLKVRPAEEIPETHFASYKPIALDYRGLSTQCPGLAATGRDPIRPTRVLSDAIKVQQYLSDMAHGYRELANFQERTYLYARPFLFDKKTRATFAYRNQKSERQLDLGIGIQWSSGTPFHFQSLNKIGVQEMEFTPAAMPVFGFRSDVKAHIFHAHLSGDFRGLAGGSRLYNLQTPDATDTYGNGQGEVQTGFNYLLLMGADYGPFSLSAGYFYPVHYLRSQTVNREVLANRPSFAYRVMYTTSRFRYRIIVSPFHFDSSQTKDTDVLVGQSTLDSGKVVSGTAFDGYFWRAGVDYDWTHARQISADALMSHADYRESLSGTPQSFKFTKTSIVVSARQDFGDYIGLRLTGTWVGFHTDAAFENGVLTNNQSDFIPGGSLEFIF